MSNKPFVIVQFNELISGKKLVDLVHVSWLSENETMCSWPPKNMEHEVPGLVQHGCEPESTWQIFPVKILTNAKDYEQGLRRLNRSFERTDLLGSSESESQEKDQPLITMGPSEVARLLAEQNPLNGNRKKRTRRSRSLDDQTEGIVDYNGLAKYLEKCISTECEKMKRSLLLTLQNRYEKIMQAVEYRTELPEKTQAWKEIGENLPFETLEGFETFEDDLQRNEKKQDTLKEIFQMFAAGHTSYEDSITAIMTKMLKKNVQLEYSGCGKKVKGVGKKAFNKTGTYKIMEEFIRTKYHDSADKLKVVSIVSRFLSGANDRDGGRALRGKPTELV